jgi:DnaK suppressor protein
VTEAKREMFRNLVLDEIAGLEESLPGLSEALEAVAPSVSLGRLTRMEALNDKGVREAMLGKSQGRIQKLLAALDRIEKGEYGTCFMCDAPIPEARLEAIPETTLCVSCAGKR